MSDGARLTAHERVFLLVFALTLFIGMWHALPQTTIVRDESLYVGDVLRAIQAHTVTAHIAATYILSFYASYLLMLPVLAFFYLINYFDTPRTIEFLQGHYYLLYLVPRFVSLLASLATAYVLLRLTRLISHTLRARIITIGLVLSTIIITTVMHTGKMWALTTFLVVSSTYWYVRALSEQEQLLTQEWYRSSLFWCAGTAILASVNFPLAGVALLAPLFLFFKLPDPKARQRLRLFSGWWIIAGIVLIGSNVHGWVIQNETTLPAGLFSPIAVVLFELGTIISLAPLILLALIAHSDEIRHRGLFVLALSEAGLFILILGFRAPWLLIITEVWRYFFLVIILLGVALLATSLKRTWFLGTVCAISMVFFFKTLYLLSIPTTYNDVSNWVRTALAEHSVVVRNEVQHLDLPLNKNSYELFKDEFCVSRCQMERTKPLSSLLYTVVQPGLDDPLKEATLPVDYVVSSFATSTKGELVTSFGTNPTRDDYYAINYRMGLYTWQYLLLPKLGENIYVYKSK